MLTIAYRKLDFNIEAKIITLDSYIVNINLIMQIISILV